MLTRLRVQTFWFRERVLVLQVGQERLQRNDEYKTVWRDAKIEDFTRYP